MARLRIRGDLLISPVVHRESLKRIGIPPDEKRNVGAFSEGQRRYLEYHRDSVFLEARVRRDQRCNSSDVNALRILKSQTATSSWGVPRARNVSSALSIRRSGLPWRPADFWRFTAIFNSAVAAGRR